MASCLASRRGDVCSSHPTASVPAADPPKRLPRYPAPAPAADANASRPGDEYRRYFKRPETTEDYWTRLQYEIDLGRFDLAANLLHACSPQAPTEENCSNSMINTAWRRF